jgi:ATP-binding cassette subfamily C exporter for protease/lipase
VVVTHRLSILSVVDGILFLQEGSQKAFGPRDQVLESLRKAAQGGAA